MRETMPPGGKGGTGGVNPVPGGTSETSTVFEIVVTLVAKVSRRGQWERPHISWIDEDAPFKINPLITDRRTANDFTGVFISFV